MSLKQKTISGIIWSFLQNAGTRGVNFLVLILLARLLLPEDFGLVGMLVIFISLSQTLVVAGLNQALIQQKKVDEEDYSSVFYINVIISLTVYIILFIAAPYISKFYDQPVLTNLTRVLSLIFVFNAFSYVQEARLCKELQFKKLAILQVPSSVIAGVISIGMAYKGYGVWSIVALQVVQKIIFALQIWFFIKWKPLLSFNRRKAGKLFSFGSKLMFAGLINSLYDNIYLVIIGKYFPLNVVGYYQNSRNIVMNSTYTFSAVISSVTFPAFSSIQDDNFRLKKGYKKSLRQVIFWLCPLFLYAAVMATPLFRLVFTEKWLPAVPLFQILCFLGILFPLNSFNLNMVNVKGRSDMYLKLTIAMKVITTLGILISISFGIYALVIFQVIDSIIAYVINSHFGGRLINYPILEQLKDVTPTVVFTSIVAGIIGFLDNSLTFLPDIVRLSIGLGMGGGLYWLIAYFGNFPAYNDFVEIVKNRRSKALQL